MVKLHYGHWSGKLQSCRDRRACHGLCATAREAHVVAITGGGTAGHVFPGIAVAEHLDCRVLWIGSDERRGGEARAGAGHRVSRDPRGQAPPLLFPFGTSPTWRACLAGVFASLRILRREQPSLLFSKGGFVSVPPVVAARLCGIPSFTHESDFDPGLATRINLRFCEKVFVSFPDTIDFLPPRYREKAVVTGNPVRRALAAGDAARGRSARGMRSRHAACPGHGRKPGLFLHQLPCLHASCTGW